RDARHLPAERLPDRVARALLQRAVPPGLLPGGRSRRRRGAGAELLPRAGDRRAGRPAADLRAPRARARATLRQRLLDAPPRALTRIRALAPPPGRATLARSPWPTRSFSSSTS